MQMVEQFWFGGKAPEGWQDAWGGSARAEAEGDMPLAVDVQEEEHSFVFTAEVPGVWRSDFKVRAPATTCGCPVAGAFGSCILSMKHS